MKNINITIGRIILAIITFPIFLCIGAVTGVMAGIVAGIDLVSLLVSEILNKE